MKINRRQFKNASIKTKLQVINLATTGLALFLVFCALLANEFFAYRQSVMDNLKVQAQMIGSNSTAAVVFRDKQTAQEILAALQAAPEIIRAIIYLPDGTPFAQFEHPVPQASIALLSVLEQTGLPYFPLRLHFQEDIRFSAEKIASLYIEADMQGLYRTIARYAAITALAAAGALLTAFLMLQRLRDSITSPLSGLTQLMRRVSQDKDYSLRSEIDSRDEVGSLARCFNEMLEQIQSRDSSLSDELSERKRAEARLDTLAYYDTVTGLPNRHFFNERLVYTVAQAGAASGRTVLMFIDLDNFKIINDTLGHHVGDMLLSGVGERLTRTLRSKDVIFRIGGDEFAVILEDIADRDDVASIADKLVQTFAFPFLLEDHEVHISASLGVSVCPDDATDPYALLRHADTAMYYAKERGKNTYQFFQPAMRGKALQRLNMENSLRRALEKNEFILHYQPQLDLDSGQIIGAEALLRWLHPDLGTVGPSDFIPLAEETGLIVPLGEWALRTACAQAVAWQAEGLGPIAIAVNLSGRQFKDENLVENLLRIVREAGLDPGLLDLELTESTLMDGSLANMEKLTALRDAGIRFSIDDFGTGYSSMSYLKRFPLNTLKIDRSFVDGIPENHEDVAITTAIIALAQSLNMRVIAEGVETREQADFLKRKGCPHVQGHFFSRPLSAAEFTLLTRSIATQAPRAEAISGLWSLIGGRMG
ncbi:MAG TPA: EAL domain-containing protein [Methylococcaceae bacterium]|nr:EAL domain-containing protein [Methylococcaceae bacterium]